MDPIYGVIGVVLAALISGYVAWIVPRRTKSGQINTSEAATLWDEGTIMRKELRDEVKSLKAQLIEAIDAVADLNREVKASRNETEQSRSETRQARAETRKSREETRLLMVQIEELHDDVKTFNRLTLGNLADNAETRRILLVPKEERTDTEFDHIANVDNRQPEGDHPPVSDEELRDEDRKEP